MNNVLATHKLERSAKLKEETPDNEVMKPAISRMLELRNFIPQCPQRKRAVCAAFQQRAVPARRPTADGQYARAEVLAIVNRILWSTRELTARFDVHAQISPSAESHDEVDVGVSLDAVVQLDDVGVGDGAQDRDFPFEVLEQLGC